MCILSLFPAGYAPDERARLARYSQGGGGEMSRKLFGLALASMMVFTVACAEEEPEMEEMPAAEETMPAPAPGDVSARLKPEKKGGPPRPPFFIAA
jgi:hypothetical protein